MGDRIQVQWMLEGGAKNWFSGRVAGTHQSGQPFIAYDDGLDQELAEAQPWRRPPGRQPADATPLRLPPPGGALRVPPAATVPDALLVVTANSGGGGSGRGGRGRGSSGGRGGGGGGGGELSRQFWQAGSYKSAAGEAALLAEVARSDGLDRARTHPKFLHSNATSHKWALGAIAELLDNAYDQVFP